MGGYNTWKITKDLRVSSQGTTTSVTEACVGGREKGLPPGQVLTCWFVFWSLTEQIHSGVREKRGVVKSISFS